MRFFKLPDLGEGLPEAEIVEWYVAVGDQVETDQPLVSVETAKAIVDVPSPQTGTIVTLFGEVGDIIVTGEPLVEFDSGQTQDTGTVVGELKRVAQAEGEDAFIIGAAPSTLRHHANRATPAVRSLAQRLNIDINTIAGSSGNGLITSDDVEQAAALAETKGEAKALKGVRRTMAQKMAEAHQQVVNATLVEDADIHAWPKGTDITMRLAHAIAHACEVEPALNAWFDGASVSRRLIKQVDLGIAVDTPDGLFVPVLHDVGHRPMTDLREGLQRLRHDVQNRTIPPSELQGASFTLSNYGTLAGRYGTPVVMPPTVGILGAGAIREEVVPVNGQVEVHRIMPLSLSFDHRAVTGGEAARFLAAVVTDLAQPSIDRD